MRHLFWAALLLTACTNAGDRQQSGSVDLDNSAAEETAAADNALRTEKTYSATALSMMEQGMVDVRKVDSTIQVSLMYSRSDNFMGQVLYDDLKEGLLHPRAAEALAKAERRLMQKHPDLRLVVFDATRPMSIQQKMWDVVKDTPKYFYVSNPARGGGLHNYGMAVDISIGRVDGDTLPMGAKVDYMGDLSHIDHEDRLVAQKRISPEARANRQLLREVMRAGGFMPIRTEWWHFNLCSRKEAARLCKPVE